MKIRWYRSATVGIFSDDESTSILCDPWITDGAFIGSWYHWPPLSGDKEFESLLGNKWSAIYISHLHADHFDRKWISKYVRQNPETLILIPKHTHKWLSRAILSLGVPQESIVELDEQSNFYLGKVKIEILPADICNPEVCGLSTPCFSGLNWKRSIDSVAVFKGDGQTIVNSNDAMATESVPAVMRFIEDCDLFMASYGGAGPYPQCFPSVQDKDSESEKLAKKFVEVVAKASKLIGAKAVFPFAGQYLLGGSLTPLNATRSVLELGETVKYLNRLGISNVITLAPFATYSVTTGEVSESYEEPSSVIKAEYLERISKDLFPYQKQDDSWPTYEEDVKRAFCKLEKRYSEMVSENQTSKYQSGVSFLLQGSKFKIELNYSEFEVTINTGKTFNNLTTISADDRLIRNLIRRPKNYAGFTPMHWNQAEIGSHFQWERQGEYFADLHYLFNFFQT
jgi:UDP-MurNAc hydroxylase